MFSILIVNSPLNDYLTLPHHIHLFPHSFHENWQTRKNSWGFIKFTPPIFFGVGGVVIPQMNQMKSHKIELNTQCYVLWTKPLLNIVFSNPSYDQSRNLREPKILIWHPFTHWVISITKKIVRFYRYIVVL